MSRRPSIRVFQFATGNVGGDRVKRIVQHLDLELLELDRQMVGVEQDDAGGVLLGEMRAQLDEERVWSETSTGTRMAGSGAEGETLAD